MDKGKLHHKWTKIRRFRPVYFVILFIISAVICLFALRHNNLQMAELRSQVYAADKSGKGLVPALQNLQSYVTSHMNTNLSSKNGINPPIQLRYTYQRHQQATISGSSNSSKFYTEAQEYCKKKYPNAYFSYVRCNEDYLKSHNLNIKVDASTSPAAMYKLDFASPTWSPDLAGWSLVASVLFLVLAIVSFLVDFWFKRQLKN